MDTKTIQEGKLLACIAYVPIFGIIIAHFSNLDKKNEFTNFHIRQAFGIWLLYFVCGISVSNFDSANLRLALWVFFGVLLLYGLFNAIIGKAQTVPVLGPLFQKLFSSLGK